MLTPSTAHLEFPGYPDPRDIDEAVERDLTIDEAYERKSPGEYVALLNLPLDVAHRLDMERLVALRVSPTRVGFDYAYDDGRPSLNGTSDHTLDDEPSDPDAQARAYAHALRDPEVAAVEYAEQAALRDAELADA